MRTAGLWIGAWLLAALLTALLGSIIQTQFNMQAIASLDVPVSLAERLAATGADLLYFGPVWLILVALALLIAFPCAALIARARPDYRRLLHVVAGAAAVLALILILNTLAPMTIIAATRSMAGTLAMALPGLVGGWVFATTRDLPERAKHPRSEGV